MFFSKQYGHRGIRLVIIIQYGEIVDNLIFSLDILSLNFK